MATTKEQRERAKKGIRARQDAISALIRNHQDEFDEIHRKNRLALGLTPQSSGPSVDKLEERKRKLEEQLERIRKQLDDAA